MSGPDKDLWESRPDDLPPELISELLLELQEIEEGDDLLQVLEGLPAHHQLAPGLGEDERLQRRVAIHRLAAGATPKERQYFVRELRLRSQLEHPGVLPVYGLFRDAEGCLYYTAPALRGRPLPEVLAQAPGAEGGWPRTRLLQVLQSVCETLDYAHRRQVFHQGLKPDLVVVGEFGEVWVTGWGGAEVGPGGCPGADLRAMGGMLASLLAGDQAPAPLQAIAAKAQTEVEDRSYPSMAALVRDLQAFLNQQVVQAWHTGTWAELRMWVRRQRGTCLVAVALVVSLLVAALGLYGVEAAGRQRIELAKVRAEAALLDLRRLADTWRLAEMLDQERELWPVVPEKVDAMAGWIAAAESLSSRQQLHEERLDQLKGAGATPGATPGATAGATAGAEIGPLIPGSEEEWEHGVLRELIGRMRRLQRLLPTVRRRQVLAATLLESSVTGTEATARWRQARAEIASLPVYRGLQLSPQKGLVPLWRDAPSGLWQFLHLASGEEPARHPDTGQPATRDATGVVLMLLPGGMVSLGSRPPSLLHLWGAPHVDPRHREDEGPVHRVRLLPFLISRYELTQAQWQRLGLQDDSNHAGPLFPVENLSHDMAREFCRRARLRLPTEAQWEYACRGGRATVYWSGNAPRSLADHGNVASREMPPRSQAEAWQDGHLHTARVGSYRPNGHGLFDMHGNVREWCRDWYDLYESHDPPAAAGDGLRGTRPIPYTWRILRGGSWARMASSARSACREAAPPEYRDTDTGLRPVRHLDS